MSLKPLGTQIWGATFSNYLGYPEHIHLFIYLFYGTDMTALDFDNQDTKCTGLRRYHREVEHQPLVFAD